VGKKMNMVADFEDFTAPFPNQLSSAVGQQGKTLVVFWEPSTGLNTISDGSLDGEITQFAAGAKSYGYPVILVPFDEMNLNEGAWGAGMNGNTPAIFIAAWDHVHDMFAGDTNVKFAIDYNNVSVPNNSDNTFVAYYPGANYVDYVGIDGFNFGNPWKSFSQVFSSAISEASQFNKPIYILSTGTVPGPQKASWIGDMGTHIKSYSNVIGWVWFNSNSDNNWIVNTDPNSLAAFRNIVP
jgi:endoglucanase